MPDAWVSCESPRDVLRSSILNVIERERVGEVVSETDNWWMSEEADELGESRNQGQGQRLGEPERVK